MDIQTDKKPARQSNAQTSAGGPTSHLRTSASRAKKEKIVAELLGKVNRAKGFVFTSYQGLTHKQLEGLKKAVKAFDADFVATKNTLIKIAMLNSKHEIRNSKQIQNSNDENSKRPSVSDFGFRILDFQGATATLFLYGDPVMPLKAIAKSIKELNLPSIKFGILDGLQMTSEQLLKLSTLPTRKTLLAQLVVGFKSPISGLHRALNWNIQKFVMTLSAIQQKKS